MSGEWGVGQWDFDQDDLKQLAHLADRIVADSEWCGRRLVVEVWAQDDSGPVAWIENHPSDSSPAIRFTAPAPPVTVPEPEGGDEG